MKKLILIIFFTFSFLSNISAQNNCPTISVTAPNSITPIGDSMTFTAHIEGIDLSKINYEWIVSAGTITSGQNTSTITVTTNADLARQTITAVVKIIGLPQECKNEVSGTGEIRNLIMDAFSLLIDEYEKIPWRDEKIRLESLVFHLNINTRSDVVVYFLIQTNGTKSPQLFKLREARIKKYLFDNFKIPNERLKFVDKRTYINFTRIYLVPKGAEPPQ